MSKSLAQVLTFYHWERLRPGENESDFKFSGPGVCLLAREVDENQFFAVDVLASNDDALSLAKKMLAWPRDDEAYYFAMLTRLNTMSERDYALKRLAPFCENTK